MTRPVLQIISASTRAGRKGIAVARWVQRFASQHGGFDVELVDLAEVGLPVFDEPNHPRLRQYVHQSTKDWSATVSRADAFVFVTPEYNHSFPASLKNALDHLSAEWADKAAGLVSYGVHGGVRAAEHLRLVLGEVQIADVRQQVSFAFATDFENYSVLTPTGGQEAQLTTQLDQLVAWAGALQSVRAEKLAAAA